MDGLGNRNAHARRRRCRFERKTIRLIRAPHIVPRHRAPKVEEALGPDSLELLGDEMSEDFEDARAGDFRGPLYSNLQQVFAGVLKPASAEDAADKDSNARVASSKPAARAKLARARECVQASIILMRASAICKRGRRGGPVGSSETPVFRARSSSFGPWLRAAAT